MVLSTLHTTCGTPALSVSDKTEILVVIKPSLFQNAGYLETGNLPMPTVNPVSPNCQEWVFYLHGVSSITHRVKVFLFYLGPVTFYYFSLLKSICAAKNIIH